MLKPTAVLYDTKDDRREIWHLLHRLPPHRRLAWLHWCCRLVARSGQKSSPIPPPWMKDRAAAAVHDDRADLVFTNELYADAWHLAHQWRLDWDLAAGELVRRVRAWERR